MNLLDAIQAASMAAGRYELHATESVRALLSDVGKARGAISGNAIGSSKPLSAFDQCQHAVHGIAWIATYAQALSQLHAWLIGLHDRKQLTATDELIAQIASGEYLNQLCHGISMSQLEIVRPADLGAESAAKELAQSPGVSWLISEGNSHVNRYALAQAIGSGDYGNERLTDDTLNMVRDTFRRFARERIRGSAHAWHLADALIPDEIIAEMAELGAFGVTISEKHGGQGLGKLAMCVVSEELSRGYLTVGSLGTRSEIAAELISLNGTPEQQNQWLGPIASGVVLPCAVFTEPDVGSDLASLRSRARLADNGLWHISGNKTWTTHGSRSDMMTLLARTSDTTIGHDGLSMFLAPKPRGNADDAFPAKGMSGSEIQVLGYRGMKEYEIAFDDFAVPTDGLLGGKTGLGFRQLMQTFESARIQTAARALGVAWDVLDVARQYALERRQFGRALIEFPRVANKLAMMLAETVMARELTYFAAREKDCGKRCDMQAGMAKLLGARVAWANADCALQIHGGNGYALEYDISRLLCDARILNIFEGAGEIQAHVIGKRLLA